MTDLCYNCGICHLPEKCVHSLKTCPTCNQGGHTWNFCHRGARVVQDDYKYFALCHNCDSWHLPDPCQRPDVFCPVCRQKGHVRAYCPVSPSPRKIIQGTPSSTPSKKRKHDSFNQSEVADGPAHMSANTMSPRQILQSPYMGEEVYKMRMATVHEVLDLAMRYSPQDIFRYLSQAYAGATFNFMQQHSMMPSAGMVNSSATFTRNSIPSTPVQEHQRSAQGNRLMLENGNHNHFDHHAPNVHNASASIPVGGQALEVGNGMSNEHTKYNAHMPPTNHDDASESYVQQTVPISVSIYNVSEQNAQEIPAIKSIEQPDMAAMPPTDGGAVDFVAPPQNDMLYLHLPLSQDMISSSGQGQANALLPSPVSLEKEAKGKTTGRKQAKAKPRTNRKSAKGAAGESTKANVSQG